MTGFEEFGDQSLNRPLPDQRKRLPRARRALGLFAVAWLTLVLRPCAMAADDPGGCPGCPPATGHEEMSSHAPDAPDAGVPCAADAFDCLGTHSYSHDPRGARLPPAKVQGDGPGSGCDGGPALGAAATLDTAGPVAQSLRDPMPDTVRREIPDPRALPRRNVLFCVYLK